ncbi:MAG TPA: response regulator transcription factor [Conexibacter sp.]|nr:response regulator transcription factor [Conexibacter sp.]
MAPMPMASRGTVLVVDDEATIVEVVGRYLARAGFQARGAFDGPGALEAARRERPDLVMLDVMLPGFDGIEVMRRLHEQPGEPVPVILLTARAEESDRLIGLRRGADDYVVKPFSPAELVARVEAVMRRAGRVGGGADDDGDVEPIVHGALRIDQAARTVALDGEELALTQREYELLRFLAIRPGRVFSRDQLMQQVWGYDFYTDTSTVTVHVRRLRAKLEPDPATPRYIETVWGVGYRFRP